MRSYKKAESSPETDMVEEQWNQDAANNGKKAEQILVNLINQKSDSTRWIVEEIGKATYLQTKAKLGTGSGRPDVILFHSKTGREYAHISLKCCRKYSSAFNQVTRMRMDRFVDEFQVPSWVRSILKRYTEKRWKLLPGGRRYKKTELDRLLVYLNSNKKRFTKAAFEGNKNAQQADWLMLHQRAEINWEAHVGQFKLSHLILMRKLVKLLSKEKVILNQRGTICFGCGVTLQRKGGDRGKRSGNDLQFKLRMRPMLVSLGLWRERYS